MPVKFADYLVKYWVLIVACVIGISSVTVAGQKINTMEEAIKKHAEQTTELQDLKTKQEVLIVKTKAIVDSVKLQKEVLDRQEAAMIRQQQLLTEILLKVQQPN